MERLQNENKLLTSRQVDLGPFKKQVLALEEKLIAESQKVGALNRLLLEEKGKLKNVESSRVEQNQSIQELKHLLVESNEKLQMALQREQSQLTERQEMSDELEAFRRQDTNGVNAILFEKLNATRTRISELEQAHSERLGLIAKMQMSTVSGLGTAGYDTLAPGSGQIVTECQSELGELMTVVGAIHTKIRAELE